MPKKPLDLFKFWDELKRRKVVKASIVYLAAAFAILQGVDVIFPKLGLPDWTVTFVIILLIIVFILVVILTWIYDITPEGIKVTQAVEEEEKPDTADKGTSLSATGQHKAVAVAEDEAELQKKVRALEDQLAEAKRLSLKKALGLLARKVALPFAIIVVLIFLVAYKQKIAAVFGVGNAKREEARSHNAKATLYIDNGDLDAAGREVKLALESDPDYSYAWSNQAVISYKQGDPDKAVSEVIKAVSLDPSNSRAPYNLAYLMDNRKDYNQAIHWYKKAISIDSLYKADTVYTAASSALGRLFNSIGQPTEAIIILERARKLFPESKNIGYVYKNLGNSFLLQNMSDTALKYLELADRLNPGETETSLFLAKAYEATGQINRSIEQWQKYIDLETDTAKISAAAKHSKELAIKQLQEIIKK
jgi:tetratricopeptide (TPR) repeat protein